MFTKVMTSHFRWYGDEAAPTVPFNRRYYFPEEANHAKKSIIKMQPRNQNDFSPTGNNEIRIDFPTDGFLDPKKTLLEFDVTLNYKVAPSASGIDYSIVRFQNGIQSIFEKFRLSYGSTNLEEIEQYHKLTRLITTHTGTGQTGGIDQMSITDGVAGAAWGATGTYGVTNNMQVRPGMVNGRQAFIQGISLQKADVDTNTGAVDSAQCADAIGKNQWASHGFGGVPFGASGEGAADQVISVTRRYSVPILCGLMQQSKLIPLKFMAQLQAVFNLARSEECIFWQKGSATANGVRTPLANLVNPYYSVSNISLNCEILHFDSQYNADFLEGLKTGGVPIKFASFTHFQLPGPTNASSYTGVISEKARSVKAVFAIQGRETGDFEVDNGASFSTTSETPLGALISYQYKVGTAFYPAQPVYCCQANQEGRTNGGSEAYSHLQRAFNMMGDSRLSTTADIINWTSPIGKLYNGAAPMALATDAKYDILLNEYDGKYSVTNDEDDRAILFETESSSIIDATTARLARYGGRGYAGNWTSAQFVMAMSFDTSNGIEISGINALQQSDIHLTIKWKAPQRSGMTIHAWTYYDSMLLLLENNVVQTIK
jgi:hypothetical protein